MFDFAWSELALIALVALVVIGPKDLPRVMRTAGQWMRKARTIAHEFQGSLEQMVREAELDEVRQTIEEARNFNVENEIVRHADPDGELRGVVSDQRPSTEIAELPKPAQAPQPDDAPAPHEPAAAEGGKGQPAPGAAPEGGDGR
jgi:sec-independent protein translocase protein TatB